MTVLARDGRAEGREGGPERRLVLLAAEAPAQAPRLHLDVAHREAEDPGHRLLDPGRGLGAGEDEHAPALPGLGYGALGLEVDVLLAARLDAALDHDRATRECGLPYSPDSWSRARG